MVVVAAAVAVVKAVLEARAVGLVDLVDLQANRMTVVLNPAAVAEVVEVVEEAGRSSEREGAPAESGSARAPQMELCAHEARESPSTRADPDCECCGYQLLLSPSFFFFLPPSEPFRSFGN